MKNFARIETWNTETDILEQVRVICIDNHHAREWLKKHFTWALIAKYEVQAIPFESYEAANKVEEYETIERKTASNRV